MEILLAYSVRSRDLSFSIFSDSFNLLILHKPHTVLLSWITDITDMVPNFILSPVKKPGNVTLSRTVESANTISPL